MVLGAIELDLNHLRVLSLCYAKRVWGMTATAKGMCTGYLTYVPFYGTEGGVTRYTLSPAYYKEKFRRYGWGRENRWY